MTVEQIKAIELIAIGGMTNTEIANTVGVSETTIYNWKRDNEFRDACLARAKELYKITLPDVQRKLIEKAKAGDVACLRIYFDHMSVLEKLSKEREYNISFSWQTDEDNDTIQTPSIPS